MEHFFVTGETQANAIEKLQNLKQGGKMIEEFWIKFNTWWNLTGYNEIALVGLFQNGLHPALGRKLMEVAGLKDTNSLETWYIKAVEFK
jgi:hypothetical protein